MTLTGRDKRAIVILAVAVGLMLVIGLWPEDTGSVQVVGEAGSTADLKQRLARVRRLAAEVPAKQQELGRLQAELAEFEAGLIRTETGQQAQAELLQVLRRIASNQVPPLDFDSEEIGQLRPIGQSGEYGEALVSVSFVCAIEQLVNLLADLTAQSELAVTDELRITPLKEKEKTLRVRLTIAGLIPRSLVPKQGGLASF